MKTKLLSTLIFCKKHTHLSQKKGHEVYPDFKQSNPAYQILNLTLTLSVLFISGVLHAQIQFEQILPPLPAPQNTADLDAVTKGSVAFADVDGDGDLDVLITGRNSLDQPTANLYINDGLGNYNLLIETPFEGIGESSIAFADVDGDGDQDVLITGENGSQSIAQLYINDGLGSFSLESETPFDGVVSGSVAFADVDGDGDQDVLITGWNNAFQRIAKLYTNDGSGGFTLVSDTPFDGVRYGSIAFTDVDGDGDQDVLITGENTALERIAKLYTNDGLGGFTLVSETPFDGVRYGSIAFSDVDGDGDQDVLITGASVGQYNANLYTNDGSGGFTLVSGTPFTGAIYSSIAFADVNGDGAQDVLITGHIANQRSAKLYINDGSGSFTFVSGTPFHGVRDGSIAFADVDGDGDEDVLITGLNEYAQRSAKLFANDGLGGYTFVSGSPFEGVSNGSLAFADVDGDGDQDVLITGMNSLTDVTAKLYINDGSGGYSLMSGTLIDAVWASSIAFADVDGDGDQDVLITGGNSSGWLIAKLYINDGLGSYTLVSDTPFDGVAYGSHAFADIDGDGDQDLLITGSVGFFQSIAQLYTNDGSGGYTLVNDTPFEGVKYSSIAFADVDGDGDQDVLVTGENIAGLATAKLYLNDGSGGYSESSGTPFDGVRNSSVAFADVDGDGDQDVLITGENNDNQLIAKLFTNDGLGGYTLVNETPFDSIHYGSFAFIDVDGDGDPDVLITGESSHGQPIAKLYTNDGLGDYTLVSGTPFSGVADSFIAIADVDGDGDQDVLITGNNGFNQRISRLYRNESIMACAITANCVPYSITLSPEGTAALIPDDVSNGSTVSCGTPILTLSQTFFDMSHIGENTVTLAVEDAFGNSDSCQTIVTVEPPAVGNCYATEVVEYIPGTSVYGGPLPANRTQPNQALGEPEGTDAMVFTTLGYTGSITLAFDGPVPNGEGADIEVVETSFGNYGCLLYPEYADVYLSQNGTDFFLTHTVCRFDNLVEIDSAGQGFEYITHVKLVNNDVLTTTLYGFDLDGMRALHNCGDGFAPDDDEAAVYPGAEAINLLSSHPNPSSGLSTVFFKTVTTSHTTLEVFDMNGRSITTLYNQLANQGQLYQFTFDGTYLANGIYIYRLTTDNDVSIEKFLIVR